MSIEMYQAQNIPKEILDDFSCDYDFTQSNKNLLGVYEYRPEAGIGKARMVRVVLLRPRRGLAMIEEDPACGESQTLQAVWSSYLYRQGSRISLYHEMMKSS
jgi:hypothetical protein